MTRREKPTLREAEFNPKVKTYWLLGGAFILFATVVGIVLLPFWFLVGNYVTGLYLSHMRCRLTPRTLDVAKGWFVRTEKTIPLDKITDLGLVHGPIMRYLGLQALSVETAGQSGTGALVKLIGIVDTEDFREAVLDQRDLVVEELEGGDEPAALAYSAADSNEVLVEIRDVLRRIEGRLGSGS